MSSPMGRIASAVVITCLMLCGGRSAAAQDSPPGVAEQQLATAAIAPSQAGSGKVSFAQLTIPSAGTARLAATAEPSLYVLLEGTWTVRAEPTPSATPASTVSIDGAPIDPRSDARLGPGSHLLVPARTAITVRNEDSQQSVSIAIWLGEQEDHSAGTGVVWRFVGDPFTVPAGAIQVTLTRLTVEQGAMTAAHRLPGPELLHVQSGSVLLALNPGQARILRASGSEESLQADYVEPSERPEFDEEETEGTTGTPMPGTVIGLDIGDGVVLAADGTWYVRAGNDDARAVVFEVALVPTNPSPGTGTPSS
jgi:hypothetical protein